MEGCPTFPTCPFSQTGRLAHHGDGGSADRYWDSSKRPGTRGGAHPPRRYPEMMTQWNTLAAYLRARFGDTERGASLVEYALLVALIAVVCIAAVTLLGSNASSKVNKVGAS